MTAYSLPHLYLTGSNFEIGRSIGREFKDRINRYLNEFDFFKSKILPFIETDDGKKIMKDYLDLISEKFPWYLDEMKGISEGSEIEFSWIFALNLRVEILHLTGLSKEKHSDEILKECSDFFLINDKYNILIHNEDTNEAVYKTGYIITCKIFPSDYKSCKSPLEEFTSYCYPGHLPGNAFGFNSSGFCFGVNALYSKEIILKRFPRQIVNRLMLAAKSLQEFEDLILNNPISYGVSLNVGFFGDDDDLLNSNWLNEYNDKSSIEKLKFGSSFNYEIAPNKSDSNKSIVSKHCIVSNHCFQSNESVSESFFTKGFYYHVNCYERINTEEFSKNSESSSHRIKRIKKLKIPENLEDMLDLASDDFDTEFPIFRTPRKTDKCLTVATAVFDLKSGTLQIYNTKPSINYKCFLKISMR